MNIGNSFWKQSILLMKSFPKKNWEQKISDIKKYNIDTFVIGDDWKGKFVLKGIL